MTTPQTLQKIAREAFYASAGPYVVESEACNGMADAVAIAVLRAGVARLRQDEEENAAQVFEAMLRAFTPSGSPGAQDVSTIRTGTGEPMDNRLAGVGSEACAGDTAYPQGARGYLDDQMQSRSAAERRPADEMASRRPDVAPSLRSPGVQDEAMATAVVETAPAQMGDSSVAQRKTAETSLAALLKDADAYLAEPSSSYNEDCPHCVKLDLSEDTAIALLMRLVAAIRALQAETDRLRAALQPFANLVHPEGLAQVGGGTLIRPEIRVQIIKDAHAAFRSQPEPT